MSTYFHDDSLTLLLGDAVEEMRTLPDGSVACIVTSPPYYGLRDYGGHVGQIGLEDTPADYVARLVAVFDEARRVLADDGTLWLNLGDSYATKVKGHSGSVSKTLGTRWNAASDHAVQQAHERHRFEERRISPGVPEKNLLGIPWRVAFALQDSDWTLRNAIVWHKPNAMPESVRDRLSTRYEMLFLFAKSRRYWFDLDPIREPLARPEAIGEGIVFGGTTPPGMKPQTNKGATGARHAMGHERGRNPGDVWSIPTTPLPDAHFAAFPVELPRRCILAGCRPGGVVLDPFSGAGTTALAAQQLGRRAIGIDVVADYHRIALRRMQDAPLPLIDGAAS